MLWLIFTLFAAFTQAVRNALQKQLSQSVPTLGVTLARFLAAWPLALLYLLAQSRLAQGRGEAIGLEQLSPAFYLYCFAAGLAQIIATALMVQLFRLKNYAIGVGLARSEAMLAAIIGVCFFSSPLSPLGWLGVILGSYGVLLLSGGTLRSLSPRVICLGLVCGLCFALTSLWVRQASLSLAAPPLLAAAWTLFAVIFIEACGLSAYLLWRDRNALRRLLAQPRLLLATSTASCIASLFWFSAMSLQNVAIVKTVGQIEILFMLLISRFVFKEQLKKQDGLGLMLICCAALLLLWL